ncbi:MULTISPECIES: GTP-binding protein [unclassified Beijerinckia]|uniref:CobW family GTP-binding protein n=1 Tax=unclassified Beijerinckia TaxID=2638183 RepID=UPI00089D8602|nr:MULTISPECIES: GTP-binding protein [unclassified Beijerinckia]MDH7799689.1 G3E family GTPase [Beijerinckia sp. GAS462]SEB49484.1 GTPase, G3E family [Beijerinckia sp. 28-YEA-48]
MADDRIPVTLLTGFLGSGKTTLLNAWLRSPELADAAVIVNEFGEVGIDHALIASSNDNTIELSTGCLCCTVRGDLVNTLRELIVRREKGEVRAFNRVVIETTGLADPAPVIQALMTFPVARRFRLRQVVTTVDAVNGAGTLANHPESIKQVAVADELILTKVDVGTTDEDSIVAELRKLNRGAQIHRSSLERISMPNDLEAVDIYDPATKGSDVARWLNAEAHAGHDDHGHDTHGHDHHGDHHHHDVTRHSADISSFVFEFDTPLHWEHVANWIDALVMAHGQDLLRVKGIVDVVGRDRPIVIQAVQSLMHPPFELAAWPQGPQTSRIVFITRKLSRAYVGEVLDTLRQRAPDHSHNAAA